MPQPSSCIHNEICKPTSHNAAFAMVLRYRTSFRKSFVGDFSNCASVKIPAMHREFTLVALLAIATICASMATPQSANSERTKKLQVLVLENGIFDCANVVDSIDRYFASIADLGFGTSLFKIDQSSNNETGIKTLIINQYQSKGIEIFILVGNDIKFPIRASEEAMIGAPADGVLCDTNGELTVDGWNQSVKAFTSEVTIAYVFPPGIGLTADAQRNLVIGAFDKFESFHRKQITYSNMGITCGHFDNDMFTESIRRMTTASETLFGKNCTTEKELTEAEAKTYFEKAPAYFGVSGHGSPMVVETSSAGDYISCTDFSNEPNEFKKTPLFLEVFGCWTSGWTFGCQNDPWNAGSENLAASGIFKNNYTVALVAGFPESSAEYSFSSNVLSEFSHHPDLTLGELMLNKTRRCGDWVLFGDPTLRIEQSPEENIKPIASIEYLYPTPIEQSTAVYFEGSGTDADGTIVAYEWKSSIDGQLSTSKTFSTTKLSAGTHTVYFKVKDNAGGTITRATY